MAEKKLKTPYAVLRFPQNYQFINEETAGIDGLWVDRSAVLEVERYDYQLESGGHIHFEATDRYESRNDGEYGEIYLAKNGKLVRMVGCQLTLDVATLLRGSTPEILKQSFETLRRQVIEEVGDRQVTFGPHLTLNYVVQAFYDMEETNGGAEQARG